MSLAVCLHRQVCDGAVTIDCSSQLCDGGLGVQGVGQHPVSVRSKNSLTVCTVRFAMGAWDLG